MPRPPGPLATVLALLGNLVLFFVAGLIAVNVVRLATFLLPAPFWGALGGEWGRLGAAGLLAYGPAGILAHAWSRHWSVVALPAYISFLAVVVGLSVALFLTDHGDPAQAWQYVLPPDLPAFIAAAAAMAGALAGYGLGARWHRDTPPACV